MKNPNVDGPSIVLPDDYLESLNQAGLSLILIEDGLQQDTRLLEKKINDAISNALLDVAITTRIGLKDLTSKIMVLNLIEDNF